MFAAMRRASSTGFVVFVISRNPIFSEGFLCGDNIKLAAADHVAYELFESVLGLSIPFQLDAAARLRP
jgi:hypothetical protein